MTDPAEKGETTAARSAAPRAKHLKGKLPLVGAPPELVPARMVNEVLYCERLAYLEWAQKEFADNFYTVEGRAVTHRRVDQGGKPPEAPSAEAPWEARSVWLSSQELGLTAKVDLVEADGGKVAPVEYKRGKKPDLEEGAWLPERAQLCAQVLLLRAHGYECEEAWIWFAGSRAKVAIAIDDALVQTTREAIARVRRVVAEARLPDPLVDSPKCRGCSLASLCLPDEVHALRERVTRRLRRLHPSRDDRAPLYVAENGAKVGVRKQRLVVKSRDGSKAEVRIPNTTHVCLFGNVQVSTQAMRALLSRGIPIAFFTSGGWYSGRTLPHDSKNVELRVAQYRATGDEAWRLRLARQLVRDKILNARTLLRRNHASPSEEALFELKQLARKAAEAPSRRALLGIEGTAARRYFAELTGMLKGAPEVLATFDFNGRNRRPPKDPINALLGFAYALLTKDWALTCQLVGLDPLLGFFHEPRFGRPALALDLMEPFRPLIADSAVIGAINNGEVGARDFLLSTVGCSLTARGRRKLIGAYERRMSQTITHPTFGYRISYRRILEVQARLLGRHLLGELDEYPSFRTR
ncbi:MAG TPA: CRISPR-associated endonuclease Cas1 [Polyangiaceae bacterium LLY-WYZ-15_(1-7)]|nr:CRISPR-associated endonuclease Cas1 [Polyangiaceae bacterium LLY-WYZ-15_(1-7)]HJL03185.1 CRISPR-associated endonuclease Cas1 [Polyangiaceae bacterium LLY-WYZ-15_(1-7)]HJL11121.1 CRISPR-associated endonuclease Cas1 [Polyangiaceae bacterium LLY-WYZ-15_(1-7)]HJL25212.1 CRISPR-associated endonuclease Cas1 [Polyangiaceae bacterium LLY-WYZ-15_(1-7)]HJL35058.1 CRISPR-associated endonuclease Cas1 [Polyangiaceae bacterium LLY-WYZ-15_(1-7)]